MTARISANGSSAARRHAQTISGSGLGFWIANSFVAANGGRLEAMSDGEKWERR